jgi:cation diffusion facilitator CzcD-associated flavoprotein CzcO
VLAAEFDTSDDKWTIHCDGRTTIRASFFIPAIGFAAKRHFPDWKGLDTFKGVIHHSSFWPSEGVDVKDRKIAVVGTGATGIQIAQETAREARELTLFQRTPNLCCPMRQSSLTAEQQEVDKEKYPEMFKERLTHYAGFMYSSRPFTTYSHTPEEREAFFEQLWQMVIARLLGRYRT